MPVEVKTVQGEVSAKVDIENVTENKQEVVVSANKEGVANGISNGGNGHGNDKEDKDSYVFISKSDTADNDSVESDPYPHTDSDTVEPVDTNVEKNLKVGESINSVKLKTDASENSDDVLEAAQVSHTTATSERERADDGPKEVAGITKSETEDPSEKRSEQQHPGNGHQEIGQEGNLESTEEVEQLQGDRIEGQEKSDLIEKISEDLQHNEVLGKHPVESDEGKESEVVSSEVSPNDSNDGGMGVEEPVGTDSGYTINGSESLDDPTGSEPVAVLESISIENGHPPIESELGKIDDVRFTSDAEKVNASDGNGDVLPDSGTTGVAVSNVSSDVQPETQTLPVGSLDSHSSDKACVVENGKSKSEPEAIQDLGSTENSKVQPETGGVDVSVSDGSMKTSIESQDVIEPADQDGKQHITPEATDGLECHEDAGAQVEPRAADSPASEKRADAVDCTKDSVSEAAISDGLSCTNQQESENGESNLNNGGDVCLNSAEEAKDSPTGDFSGNVSLESSETLSTNINGEGESGETSAVAIQSEAVESVNTSSEAHVALPSIEDGEIDREAKDGSKVTKTNVDDVCEDIPPVEVPETGESDIKERSLINDAEEVKSDNNSGNYPLVDSDRVVADEQEDSKEEESETSGATVSLATEAKPSGHDLESEVVTSTDTTMPTGTKKVASEDAPDCVDSQLTESNGEIKLNENEIKNCTSPVDDEKAGVESISESKCSDDAADKTNDEVASEIGEIQKDLASAIEGSVVDNPEAQTIEAEVEKRPFYFLPRVPRYEDEKLSEQLKHAEAQVDQKTQSRDAIRVEIQTIRGTNKDYEISFKAAVTEERAAKKAMHSKRQEIEALQSIISRIKVAASVDDIDAQMHSMEHMIQHETLTLNQEKGYIRDIKNLKQLREQITSSMGTKDEIKQALDEREKTEERLKVLRKELDVLRNDLSKLEVVTKAAQKKYDEKWEIQNKLQEQFRAADAVRQEAFVHLQELKKQQREKNKHFFKYRDDSRAANEMALKKDRASLQGFCSDQVENFMDLWNNDDEFRKYYVKSNTRSTLRRFGTLDGRSLGPDEEPPRIPYPTSGRTDKFRVSSDKTEKHETFPPLQSQEKVVKYEGTKAEDNNKAITKPVEQKNQTTKSKKLVKSENPKPISEETVSEIEKSETGEEQPPKLTKEEEELIKKEEQKRKQKEAAKLKEQHRLEEIAKAKEAMERKKKREEKAKARAALKAQKEAEEREKEREKKLRKKERRKGITTEETTTPNPEIAITATESPREIEIPEKQTAEENQQTKKSHKPTQFLKQNKSKSIPPPLRNRGNKRKLRQWLWIGLVVLVVIALFLLGNANLSFSPENLWFI